MPSKKKNSTLHIIRTGIVFLIFFVLVIYYITNNYIWKTRGLNDELFSSSTHAPMSHVMSDLLLHAKSESFHGEQLVHLDLKGAPPMVSFFKEFFPFIKKAGATGVLIEYEDMFFYKDELEDLRAYNAYEPSEIKEILKLAELNNLMVIPLVQTFGHFEFVLKLEKYKKLREIEDFPQVLCPSHEESLIVVKKMIDQVLKAHPNSKYIHIGCDEVLYLAECDKCKSLMQKNFWTTGEVFINHVKNVAMYINETYPGVKPIVWHDMISSFNERILKKSKISSLVDLMIWDYSPNISNSLTVEVFEMIARLFNSIWIASAFKGASGSNQVLTDVKYHLVNHIAWLKIIQNWKSSINFKGIALTGWQRYDHFAELCELLPIAVPSLAACLFYINNAELGISANKIFKPLECDFPPEWSPQNLNIPLVFGHCNFPGYQAYIKIQKFYDVSLKIDSNLSEATQGWLSLYNVLYNFTNTNRVKFFLHNWSLHENYIRLLRLEADLKVELSGIYDIHTVDEWISNHVLPLRIRVEAFFTTMREISRRKVWPRRPFPSQTNAIEKVAKSICSPGNTDGCFLFLI